MSTIEITPREYNRATQLVANIDGWILKHNKYRIDRRTYITGAPGVVSQTPEHLVEPLRRSWLTTQRDRPTDSNGLKVGIRSIRVEDGVVLTDGYITDYYTLWALPREARREFDEHEVNIGINRAEGSNALYETDLPWAVCTHNGLYSVREGKIFFMIKQADNGWHAGKGSPTEEKQMEPTTDPHSLKTAYDCYSDKVGVRIPRGSVRLLGIAREYEASYAAYIYLAKTKAETEELVRLWESNEKRKNETAFFAVPLENLDEWKEEKVRPETWERYKLAGNINPTAEITTHPTTEVRLELFQRHLEAIT